MSQPSQQQVNVIIPEALRKGAYANAVSVTIGHNEVVIDFGFLQPHIQPPQMEITSRVIMNSQTAENFLSTFQNALLDFKKNLQTKTS